MLWIILKENWLLFNNDVTWYAKGNALGMEAETLLGGTRKRLEQTARLHFKWRNAQILFIIFS